MLLLIDKLQSNYSAYLILILVFLFLNIEKVDIVFLNKVLSPLLFSILCFNFISKNIYYKYKRMKTIFNSFSFFFFNH